MISGDFWRKCDPNCDCWLVVTAEPVLDSATSRPTRIWCPVQGSWWTCMVAYCEFWVGKLE
jgi:hypothetical protein